MNLFNKSGVLSCVLAAHCTYVFALDNVDGVCDLLKKTKTPIAYLLDKEGRIDKGPIDFGRFPLSNQNLIDQVVVPTQYQLIVSPARLKLVGTCPAGGVLN